MADPRCPERRRAASVTESTAAPTQRTDLDSIARGKLGPRGSSPRGVVRRDGRRPAVRLQGHLDRGRTTPGPCTPLPESPSLISLEAPEPRRNDALDTAAAAWTAPSEPDQRSSRKKNADHDHERQRHEGSKSDDRELEQAASLLHGAGSSDGACEVQGRRVTVFQLRRLLGGENGDGDADLTVSLRYGNVHWLVRWDLKSRPPPTLVCGHRRYRR